MVTGMVTGMAFFFYRAKTFIPVCEHFMSVCNKLSDKTIKSLRPEKKTYKRGDGDKLWLYVTPAGSKIWRILWFVNKKEKQFTVGEYPAISLKDARGIRACLETHLSIMKRFNSMLAMAI